MESTYPKTINELVDRIFAARENLEELLETLDSETMERPAPDGGWSVKDHLAHLSEWRRKQLALIDGKPGYVGLGVDRELFEKGGLDKVNAELYRRNRERSLDDVLIDFEESQEVILRRIGELTDEDLNRANDLTNPQDQRRLVEGIAGNTYEHDEEHYGWIRELVGVDL